MDVSTIFSPKIMSMLHTFYTTEFSVELIHIYVFSNASLAGKSAVIQIKKA